MLTASLLSRLVTERYSPSQLRGFAIHYRSRLFVGDTVWLRMTSDPGEDDQIRILLEAQRGDGTTAAIAQAQIDRASHESEG
jgi:hypothetical protein